MRKLKPDRLSIRVQAFGRHRATGRIRVKMAHQSDNVVIPMPDCVIINEDKYLAMRQLHAEIASPGNTQVLRCYFEPEDNTLSILRKADSCITTIVYDDQLIWHREIILSENGVDTVL